MSKQKSTLKVPFSLRDNVSLLTQPVVALEESFKAVRAVAYSVAYSRVIDTTILLADIGDDRGLRYRLYDPADEGIIMKGHVQTHVDHMRRLALDMGATPEAVRLLNAYEAFTQKELNIMAEKLVKKAAAKPAPKKADAAKPKGNPEALKKAREARASKEAENRKYKVTAKLKDLTLREGSWTKFMVETILAHTTTDDAKAACKKSKEYGDKKLDFTWAAAKGYIAF